MWRFTPYVFKSLWRQRTRTALTVSGAAVALFVFTFIGSVQEGLARLTRGREAERALIVFQANRYCPFSSKLPEDYATEIRKLDGVREVVPVMVFMNNCRASLDLVVFHGMPPEKVLTEVRRSRGLRLLSGDWDEFARRRDAALVGQALATRRGLDVGASFSIGEVTVKVAGIFAADQPAEEHLLFTHLAFLQQRRGGQDIGLVTQFEVLLHEGADTRAVCRAIDERYRGGPVPTDTRPKSVFQARSLGDLAETIGFLHYLGYACVGLVLALVATTTVMAVQDRIREHAVLQTLGFSWRRVFALVMVESLLVSLAGGLFGVGLAMGLLTFGNFALGTEGVTIAFAPSLRVALTGLAVTAAVGLIAGLAPACHAARAEIVTSLRQV